MCVYTIGIACSVHVCLSICLFMRSDSSRPCKYRSNVTVDEILKVFIPRERQKPPVGVSLCSLCIYLSLSACVVWCVPYNDQGQSEVIQFHQWLYDIPFNGYSAIHHGFVPHISNHFQESKSHRRAGDTMHMYIHYLRQQSME